MYFQLFRVPFFLFSFLLTTFPVFASDIDDNSLADSEIPPGWKKVGDLKPTFYWVAVETSDGGAKTKELKDVSGKILAKVSSKFFSAIRMEGTGKMQDGRILNFHARMDGEIRWRVCPPEAPYGYGLEDYVLRPFRSVAVDPDVVKIPSKVYIPAAKGTPLPDGTIHDGIFDAVDIGEAIQNQRIDVFTAYGDQSAVFTRHGGLSNMRATAVYIYAP